MTQVASYRAHHDTQIGSTDLRTLETFIVSLTKRELLTLKHLLADRLSTNAGASNNEISVSETQNFKRLTERERQVLTLVASGYSRREVSGSLNITQNTAATHIASIYRKLEISTIAEATLYAYRWGFVR